jgi:hypothetical protein
MSLMNLMPEPGNLAINGSHKTLTPLIDHQTNGHRFANI